MKNYQLIITVLVLIGCNLRSMEKSYYNNLKSGESERINSAYQNVKFDGNITIFEAEAIFNYYVFNNGWPRKMAGGNTKPLEIGNFWVVKYVDDFGLVNENECKVLINKQTGDVTIQ
jgi:hypothetical protein